MNIFVIARDRAEYVFEIDEIFRNVPPQHSLERISRWQFRIGPVFFTWIESAKDLVDKRGHYYLAPGHEAHPQWWSIGEILQQPERMKEWRPKK